MTFEESLMRLNTIVKKLESGDTTLEESLTLFKEGTALIESCNTILTNAEQQVVKLIKKDGEAPAEEVFVSEN